MPIDYKALIREVPDFPKPGVLFRDISPLLRNPEALTSSAKHLATLVRGLPVDKVVAVESRGFIFGALLAHLLNAGFVMVRRQNKLPRPVESMEYALEYGNSIVEIQPDDIEKGENVAYSQQRARNGRHGGRRFTACGTCRRQRYRMRVSY